MDILVSTSNDSTSIVHNFSWQTHLAQTETSATGEKLKHTPLEKMFANINKPSNNDTLNNDKDNKKKLVLVACGAFSPPHIKHVEMLEIAKRWMSERYQYQVVLGLLSPSSGIVSCSSSLFSFLFQFVCNYLFIWFYSFHLHCYCYCYYYRSSYNSLSYLILYYITY